MEYPESHAPLEALPVDMADRNIAIAEVIRATTDEAQIIEHIQLLSEQMSEYIGNQSKLSSNLFAWQAYRLTASGIEHELVMDAQLLARRHVEGSLTGFEYYPDERGRNILHYRLDLGFDETSGLYMSVSAPVVNAKLQVEPGEAELDPEEQEAMNRMVALLESIDAEDFKEELEGFFLDVDNIDFNNLESIIAVGHIATWLLSHDAVKDSMDHQEAIVGILDMILEHSGTYVFEGFETIPVASAEGPTMSQEPVECVGEIQNVITIEDYTEGQNGETLQPAFIIWDSIKDTEYTIPLRQVSLMQAVDEQDMTRRSVPTKVLFKERPTCSPSIDRFRDMYMGGKD